MTGKFVIGLEIELTRFYSVLLKIRIKKLTSLLMIISLNGRIELEKKITDLKGHKKNSLIPCQGHLYLVARLFSAFFADPLT
jgi:hypothetical protein